jgi:hypothetical protein
MAVQCSVYEARNHGTEGNLITRNILFSAIYMGNCVIHLAASEKKNDEGKEEE